MSDSTSKKILIIIAYQDFQDDEFTTVKDYLGRLGAKITVASSSIGNAIGQNGTPVEIDFLLVDIHPQDYDAIIFIGGAGAREFEENELAHEIARQALSHHKILGAICIAPLILANAGALSGKKATLWTDAENNETVQRLIKAKASYVDQDVVVDGKIVTANGPESAEKFARTIAEML